MNDDEAEMTRPNIDHSDPAAADRPPRPGAKDRPGFDLGGAVYPTYGGSESLTDPIGEIPIGDTAVSRAAGLGDLSAPDSRDEAIAPKAAEGERPTEEPQR